MSFGPGYITKTPPPPLLDQHDGAAAAYSLRLLRVGYNGPCIRVRRSSDNEEEDIGFSGGTLDETALLSFVGSGDGFVTTIYGQTSGAHNWTQSTQNEQGKIVDQGTVITQNGFPTIDLANGYYKSDPGLDSVTTGDVHVMFVVGGSDSSYVLFNGDQNDNQPWIVIGNDGDGNTNLSGNSGTPSYFGNGSAFGGSTRDDMHTFYDGYVIGSVASVDTSSSAPYIEFAVGGYNSSTSNFQVDRFWYETVVWPDSNNRSAREDQANVFYGAY